jgi:signal peptidase I
MILAPGETSNPRERDTLTNTLPVASPASEDSEPDLATSEETDETSDEPSALHHVGSVARELVVVVVGALIVCSLLRFFVGQMFIIPSPSMESTLLVGDKVVVQKVTDFHRGDVVVFADPGGWLRNQQGHERGTVGKAFEFIGVLPDTSTGHLVKRVIGMPGDKVICCDKQGSVTVNGQALDETPYLYRDAAGKQVVSAVKFEVVVPKDRLFVMGDHRAESADSRCHLSDVAAGTRKGETAFVPIKFVVGPSVAVVAPFNRAQRLHRPQTFATVPAATQAAPDQALIKPDNVTC